MCDVRLVRISLLVNDDAILELFGAEIDKLPVASCETRDGSKEAKEPVWHLEGHGIHACVEEFDGPVNLTFLEHAKVLTERKITHDVERIEIEQCCCIDRLSCNTVSSRSEQKVLAYLLNPPASK